MIDKEYLNTSVQKKIMNTDINEEPEKLGKYGYYLSVDSEKAKELKLRNEDLANFSAILTNFLNIAQTDADFKKKDTIDLDYKDILSMQNYDINKTKTELRYNEKTQKELWESLKRIHSCVYRVNLKNIQVYNHLLPAAIIEKETKNGKKQVICRIYRAAMEDVINDFVQWINCLNMNKAAEMYAELPDKSSNYKKVYTFLIERINEMKNNKNTFNKIAIKTIWEYCQIDFDNKALRTQQKYNKMLSEILDTLEENKYIKSYIINNDNIEFYFTKKRH